MGVEFRNGIFLGNYTTMGMGGEARFFVEVRDEDDVDDVRVFLSEHDYPCAVLGGGSNLVIGDEGFGGVILHPVNSGIRELERDEDGVIVEADAGCCWDDLCLWAVERDLGGIERMSGIPGSCGGAVVQNVGAYGEELREVFLEADVIDWRSGVRSVFDSARMGFSYRHSTLKDPVHQFVVMRIRLRLPFFDSAQCVASCMKHGFQSAVATVPEDSVSMRDSILGIRSSKGMVYRVDDVNSHGVGSFFTNPIVSKDDAARLTSHAIWRGHQRMPCFPVEGGMKLSAAWLIEKSGLQRGYRQGRVGLSGKHSLAIVNYGGGSADEVMQFAKFVFGQVKEAFGVELEPEALFLGVDGLERMSLTLSLWGAKKRSYWR